MVNVCGTTGGMLKIKILMCLMVEDQLLHRLIVKYKYKAICTSFIQTKAMSFSCANGTAKQMMYKS